MNLTECNDSKCAIHGQVKVRGDILTGIVKSTKTPKTVVVERENIVFVKKYERYKKTRSRISAHCPPCIPAKENDLVKIGETRKLSKTKAFVVLEILGAVKTVGKTEFEFEETRKKKLEKEMKAAEEEKAEEKKSKKE